MIPQKNKDATDENAYSIKEISLKNCASCKKGIPPDTFPRRLNQVCQNKLKTLEGLDFIEKDVMESTLKYYDTEDVAVDLKDFRYYDKTLKDYLLNLSNAFDKQTDYKISFQLNSKRLQFAEERPEDIVRFQKEIADAEERIPKEKHIIDFLSKKLKAECDEIAALEDELRDLDYEMMTEEEQLAMQESVLRESSVEKERIREIKPLKEAFHIEIIDNIATINSVSMKVDKKEQCWETLNQGLGMLIWLAQYFLQRQQIKLDNVELRISESKSKIRIKAGGSWVEHQMSGPLKTWNERENFKKGLSALLTVQKIVAESFFKNFEKVKELPYPVKAEAGEIDRSKLEIDLDKPKESTLVLSKFLKNWLFLIEIASDTQQY